MVKVEVEGGKTLYSEHDEGWEEGEELELLVRAQKIEVESLGDEIPGVSQNIFQGKVKSRMYMGGEAWYFVEMEDGTVNHTINISRVAPFREGDEVTLHIPPRHCRLIPKD